MPTWKFVTTPWGRGVVCGDQHHCIATVCLTTFRSVNLWRSTRHVLPTSVGPHLADFQEEVSIISLVHIISLTPRQPPNSETLLLLRSGTQRRYTGSGLSLMGSTISAEGCGMAFVHAENEMPCSRRPSSPPIVAPALNLDPKVAEDLRDWCETYNCSEVVHYSINRAMLVTLDGKSSFDVTCMGRVSIVLDSFERFWWSV
jgi:hypothetical protein